MVEWRRMIYLAAVLLRWISRRRMAIKTGRHFSEQNRIFLRRI